MTHPAVDPAAADRLRQRLGRATAGATEAADPPESAPADTGSGSRVRAAARRVGAPVVSRARRELSEAVDRDRVELQRQIDELRTDLARLRAEHAAELAALREQLG